MKSLVITCLFLFTPLTVSAVQISEIAWMGSGESANHEWIELYNQSAAIDVTGWQLTDGNNLDITLSGTIGGGEYAVLERTSDASAAGSAFLVYTGSLVNTGATLALRDENGFLIDQVVGGENWENIGGNNETKDTAQRSGAAWVTQVATPGSDPSGVVTQTQSDTSDASTSSNNSTTQTTVSAAQPSSSDSNREKIVLELKDSSLQLAIDAPPFAYVNQPVDLSVTPSGVGDALMASVQYQWNFGDGQTAQGADVTHAFAHPGRHVVVVDGQYKRQQQVTRTEIEILPVRVALSASAGEVAVINVGTTEVDLSSYRLVGRDEFVLPEHTILLPGRTLVIDEAQVGGNAQDSMLVLYDQGSVETAMLLPTATAQLLAADDEQLSDTEVDLAMEDQLQPEPVVVAAPTVVPQVSAISAAGISDQSTLMAVSPAPPRNSLFRFPSEIPTEVPAEPSPMLVPAALAADNVTATSQVAALTNTMQQLPTRWPLYTLVGLLVLGIISIYLIPSHGRGDNRV